MIVCSSGRMVARIAEATGTSTPTNPLNTVIAALGVLASSANFSVSEISSSVFFFSRLLPPLRFPFEDSLNVCPAEVATGYARAGIEGGGISRPGVL